MFKGGIKGDTFNIIINLKRNASKKLSENLFTIIVLLLSRFDTTIFGTFYQKMGGCLYW